MTPKNVRAQPEKPKAPHRNKRFQIEKLEERIAPKKGGKGTHNCPTNDCTAGCFTIGCGGY
jgi:hypothetical protein